MRKVIAFIAFLALSPLAFAELALTDPFYMLEGRTALLDSEVAYNFNSGGGDHARFLQIKETFRYGLAYDWELFASLGLGNLDIGKNYGDYDETGFTDPEFGFRGRLLDQYDSEFNIDVFGYISPSIFDSPSDNHPDGVAKGSTDFGFKVLIGKEALIQKKRIRSGRVIRQSTILTDPWTAGMYAGVDFLGKTDGDGAKRATSFYVGGVGKYYFDVYNSLDLDLAVHFTGKRYDGSDSDTSFRALIGYSREFTYYAGLSLYAGIASHSYDDAKTDPFIGARLRWLF